MKKMAGQYNAYVLLIWRPNIHHILEHKTQHWLLVLANKFFGYQLLSLLHVEVAS